MICTKCDRCGAIIEDPKDVRVATLGRPYSISRGIVIQTSPPPEGNDKQFHDIYVEVELCKTCAQTVESTLTQGTEEGTQGQ